MDVDACARPLLLRALPPKLRLAVWSRLYRGTRATRLHLYESASLEFAPGLTMELVPGDVISDAIAFTGIYELSLTRRVCELARDGGTMVEVGANLGYFSLLWAAAHPENRCIAVEAAPRNIELLRRNVSRNGLEVQIRIVPHAAGAAHGIQDFDPGPGVQTGWGGFTRAKEGSIAVEVIRIDHLVQPDEPIALLKVDTEGSDTWVLHGCERLLRSHAVREVWYEQNKPRMKALGILPSAAQDYLREFGYTAFPQGDPALDVVEWRALPVT